MLTVVTARPPSTYTFTTSLQFISILEKLYFLLLHVESNRFLALLKFLSCYYWCGVVAAEGSVRKERKLLLLLLRKGAFMLHSSQPTKPKNKFRSPVSFLSILLSFSLWNCRVKKKKKKKIGTSHLPLLQSSVALHVVAATRAAAL